MWPALSGRDTHLKAKSKKWWGRYTDALRREKRVPLATDERVAQAMLNDLVAKVERQKAGLEDPVEDQMYRPLSEHVADFEAYLRSRDVTERHVRESLVHLQKMTKVGKWRHASDIDAASVTRFLGDLRARGRSAQTYNHYLKSIKHFTRWLHRERRIAQNPLAHMSRLNVKADCRHKLVWVVKPAKAGPSIEGISDQDRAMIRHTFIMNLCRANVSPKDGPNAGPPQRHPAYDGGLHSRRS